MTDELKQAYEQYRSHDFVLQKSARHKKFVYRKGSYIDRTNDPLDDKATGYVAIVPPNIIAIDADTYEDDCQFAELIDALEFETMPEPSVISPSGGEHYFFENPYPDLVIGNHGFKSVDIFGGYQSVLPIVATTVKNKQGELNAYQWHDENYGEELIINPFNEKMLEVLKMRPRVTATTTEEWDDDENSLSLAIKEDEMSDDEVDSLLAQIPSNAEYNDWLGIGQCLYDRYEGNKAGLEKWLNFSKLSDLKHKESFTESKWHTGALKIDRSKYTKLRSIVNEFTLRDLEKTLKTANESKIKKLIKNIAKIPKLNTRYDLDDSVRQDLAEKINARLKELKKDNPKVKVLQARTVVKSLTHIPTVEDLKEQGDVSNIAVYTMGKAYGLRVGTKFIPNLTEGFVIKHCGNYGIVPVVVQAHLNQSTTITDYKVRADYNIESDLEFVQEKSKQAYEPDYLIIKNNPIHALRRVLTEDTDDEIEDDFFNKIWQGKADDLIKLTALSIRFKADKKNQLMLVTPTSFGKTRMMKHIGFGEIGMETLMGAFTGDGVGSEVLTDIQATGLMLINEVDDTIPKRFKELENEMQVKEFKGGTRSVPLHFLVFTSTHETAILKASDEVAERMMFMQLDYEDSEYNLTESPVFNSDREKYTTIVRNKMIRMFIHHLYEADVTKNDLYDLQEKYRLYPSEDLEGIIKDIHKEVVKEIKAGRLGEQNSRGEWVVTKKRDVKDYIEALLLDHRDIDVGKYVSNITSKLYTKGLVRRSNGVSQYLVNTTLEVVDEFDDLDLEEF